MTRLEKILMAVLLVLIIGTIVFWNDVSSVFNKKGNVVENEPKKEKKDKKNKKDKDDKDKKKDDKDEAGNIYFLNGSSIA
jgi:hypothetical protein